MNQETRDRIEDEEAEYYERRQEELSHQIANRALMHEKIQKELAQIRANRNAP